MVRFFSPGDYEETPPRTWGRPVVTGILRVFRRNTPTHVGKTRKPSRLAVRRQKHPHARGEDPKWPPTWRPFLETPPRTWGRHSLNLVPRICHGNTPTHVGKTERFKSQSMPAVETPPRTWGRLMVAVAGVIERRNTPTHVGKTPTVDFFTRKNRKHPHARGEDCLRTYACRKAKETPPRTWGRLAHRRQKRPRLGNTPTHVGKTIS